MTCAHCQRFTADSDGYCSEHCRFSAASSITCQRCHTGRAMWGRDYCPDCATAEERRAV